MVMLVMQTVAKESYYHASKVIQPLGPHRSTQTEWLYSLSISPWKGHTATRLLYFGGWLQGQARESKGKRGKSKGKQGKARKSKEEARESKGKQEKTRKGEEPQGATRFLYFCGDRVAASPFQISVVER